MISPHNGLYESPSHSPSVYRNPNFNNPFFGFNDSRHGEVPSSPSRPPPAATRQSYSGVAERIPHSRTDQPVVLTNRDASAGSKRVLFDLPFTDANHSIGQVGLKNLGNTCYMNSIIQCIAGTVPVARYFLDGSYKSHINKENPLGSRGVLCRAFADLIKDLWLGSSRFVSPITFKVW
jgi:ubiquitin carboxyl-terminal hydrolase 8